MTTAKVFILVMIKALLKADILWACSASAVSTCRRRLTVEWVSRDWVQMPPPLLEETGGMFEQQRTNWKKTRQVWVFPPLSPQASTLVYCRLLWLLLHYFCSSLLGLCSWKASLLSSDWLCSFAVIVEAAITMNSWRVWNNSATVRCTKRHWESSFNARH